MIAISRSGKIPRDTLLEDASVQGVTAFATVSQRELAWLRDRREHRARSR